MLSSLSLNLLYFPRKYAFQPTGTVLKRCSPSTGHAIISDHPSSSRHDQTVIVLSSTLRVVTCNFPVPPCKLVID